ncbi:MAG: YfhO family protein [Chloroflexi bacterium]|nr:YfhO family protein [Chloroflexota bacterium]
MIKREIPAWLPLALLVLVLLALFRRLFWGDTLFWGLPALQFYPWRQFAFEELRAGRLPAWNPYLGAGAPLLANYQTAVFYPPNWLMLILPGPLAMSVIALLHVVWGGLGMWYLTGALGLSSFGRGISTLAYALSGHLIARLGSLPTADAAAWIPWLFWLVQRVIIRLDGRDMGGLALVFAMQLLCGHAQTTWYTLVGLGFYSLWLVIQRRDPLRQRIAALLMIGGALLLGAAVAAIQLIPTAEYLAESQRSSGLDYATLTNLSYHPLRLFTLLSPNFFGTPADGSYITKGIYFEDAAYIGFIPCISAAAAGIGWLRKRKLLTEHPTFSTVPFWIGLVIVGLFFGLGRHNPLFRFFYDSVPTFDAFREPVRWMILTVFGLSVLAGIGTGHWGRGKWVVFWSRLAAAGGGGMAIMALAGLEIGGLESETLRVLAWGLVALGIGIVGAAVCTLIQPVEEPSRLSPRVWQTGVLLLITLDLAWAAHGLNPMVSAEIFDTPDTASTPGRLFWFGDYRYDVTFGSDKEDEVQIEGYFDLTDYRRATDQWREVRASMLPNINMLDRVPALSNNDPLLPGYHSQYIDLIETWGAQAGNLFQAAGVDRVYGITPDGWTGENPALAPFTAEIKTAWLVSRAEWRESDSAIKDALRDPAWNPLQTVILVGQSEQEIFPGATAGSVTLVKNLPSDRRYRVTSDAPAYLVIAETWYPGWSVTVNGKPAKLERANLAFLAVAVPAGESEINLRYRVNHFSAGAIISLISLLAAVGLIVFPGVRRWAQKR